MIAGTSLAQAPQSKFEQSFEVSKSLLTLVTQVENQQLIDKQMLEKLLANITPKNDAERLLVNYALGLFAFQHQRYQEAIELLEQANSYHDKLPKSLQITSPYFHFHQVISGAYVKQENYQQAYHHRRTYLIEYGDAFEFKEQQLLTELENKYQIKQKEQVNQLLEQQNKLKQAEISRLAQKKQQQERNVLVLIFICVVFLLMIIRQLRVRYQLKVMAHTDMLTGLRNRANLFHNAQRVIATALELNKPLSVLVIDIDYFKKINDKYGHQAGDEVLKNVAKLGAEVMRSRDIFGRLGGEEFVAILPDADIDIAHAIALRFKEKIEHYPFSFVSEQKPFTIDVTVSIGVAQLQKNETTADSLIGAADIAMYQAKQAGRNQVSIFNS